MIIQIIRLFLLGGGGGGGGRERGRGGRAGVQDKERDGGEFSNTLYHSYS